MTYSITFHINTKDVLAINKDLGQRITIVKSASEPTGQKEEGTVAWVAFPAQNTVVVTWEENYYIYETSQKIEEGAVINSSSNTGIVTVDELYTFADGAFTSSPGGEDGAFVAKNQGKGAFTFGLGQPAQIGSESFNAPISAIMVGNTEVVSFKPRVKLSVFLSGTQDNGTVVSQVSSTACSFTMDTGNTSVILSFNDQNNTFQQSTSLELSKAMMHQAKLAHHKR